MSKKCRDCFHFYGVAEDMNGEVGMCELQSSDCPNYKVAGQNACKMFNAQTVFGRITSSPEVLAPLLVYRISIIGGCKFMYSSKVIDNCYYTEEEAIAATVAKLKEARNASNTESEEEDE